MPYTERMSKDGMGEKQRLQNRLYQMLQDNAEIAGLSLLPKEYIPQ